MSCCHVIEERSRGRLEHGPSALDIDQGAHEHFDSILVASHHQVGKADIVASGDDARGHARNQQLLVNIQLHVLHGVDGQIVIPEQRVQAKKYDQAEVAEHFVKGALREKIVLELQKQVFFALAELALVNGT